MEGLVRGRANGDPLALAAGQLVGLVNAPVAQTYLPMRKSIHSYHSHLGVGSCRAQGNTMFSHTSGRMRFEDCNMKASDFEAEAGEFLSDRPFVFFTVDDTSPNR